MHRTPREGHADRSSNVVVTVRRWLRGRSWQLAAVLAAVIVTAVIASSVPGSSSAGGGDRGATEVGGTGSRAASVATKDLRTVVSLTFNAGSVSQYRFARPLLRRYGVNGTFFVQSGRVDHGDACCITWQEARELYRSGDEIGGSAADGLDLTVPYSRNPAVDYARKRQQVCGARARLRALGFDPRSFAYPAGAYRYQFAGTRGSLTELVASCGYVAGRIIGGLSDNGDQQAVALPPPDPLVIRTPDELSTAPIALSDLQHSVLRAARAPRRWVPLVFDEVCHRGDSAYARCMASRRPVDDAVLSEFLRWLDQSGRAGGAPAGTGVRTVRLAMGGSPQPPLPVPATVVSLTLDDGDATQQLAGDLLRAHGMHATFFVNTGWIDRRDPYYLTWPQMLQLQRDGNEIGGHTVDHVPLTDPRVSAVRRHDEVCKDRARLLQMGIDAQSFAYPEGAVDRAVQAIPRSCGYRSARTAGGVSPTGPQYAETIPPANPFATAALDGPPNRDSRGRDVGVTTPLTLTGLQRAVVAAADHGGGWVQIVLHRVCASSDPLFARCMAGASPIDGSTLGAFLDWLGHGAPSGTVVRTVGEVMDRGAR